MSKIEEFEDLIAWQKARKLTQAIYKATRRGAIAKDCGLSGQIQRAAVSIMSNIAEGFERGSPREFHQFLSVPEALCAEVSSKIYIAFDAGYLDEVSFQKLMALARKTGKIIGGMRVSVERRRDVK